jgi:hypothetical protein
MDWEASSLLAGRGLICLKAQIRQSANHRHRPDAKPLSVASNAQKREHSMPSQNGNGRRGGPWGSGSTPVSDIENLVRQGQARLKRRVVAAQQSSSLKCH